MAALQHGLPVLSTCGHLTDAILQEASSALSLVPVGDANAYARRAVELVMDADARALLAEGASRLFDEHFHWQVIAARFETVAANGAG